MVPDQPGPVVNRMFKTSSGGAAGVSLWRAWLAEATGAALLVLLSCLSPGGGPLAAGLVVAALVQSLDHVTGAQLNPTVTLAGALAGREPPRRAAVLVSAQLVGAVLGAAALQSLRPAALPAAVTKPATDVSNYQALAVELVAGAVLALANLSAWDPRNRRLLDSWPLRIGLTVAALSFFAGDTTGASMNPARSFGPALISGDWTGHWVYWVGPLSGSALAAALYAAAWRVSPDAPARGDEPPAPARTPACACRCTCTQRKLPLSP